MTSKSLFSLSDTIEKFLNKYFDEHHQTLPPPGIYDRILKILEEPLLRIALERMDGNQQKTAKLLGISRNTLRKKIETLKIVITPKE